MKGETDTDQVEQIFTCHPLVSSHLQMKKWMLWAELYTLKIQTEALTGFILQDLEQRKSNQKICHEAVPEEYQSVYLEWACV